MNIGERFIRQMGWSKSIPVLVDIQNMEDLAYRNNAPAIAGLPCLPPWRTFLAFYRKKVGDKENLIPQDVCLAGTCKSVDGAFELTVDGYLDYFNPKVGLERLFTSTIKISAEGEWISEDLRYTEEFEGNDSPGLEIPCSFFLWPLLIGLVFCHCKNVSIEKVPVSRQVRRRAEAKGEPTYEHHTIAIEPMRKVLVKKGGLAEHGDVARAMHICRGHFARYGEKFGTGKLFGKYEGQFWMPQHVRGKLERGVITKDYKVTV